MDNKFTVLVTGFGPFEKHEINASWEAVKLLPDLFEKWENSASVDLLLKQIPVAYENVRSEVKTLWEKHKPSIIIHVGVSHLARCLNIEYQAHSKGYKRPDIFRNFLEEKADEDLIVLKTACDIEKICESVNKSLGEKDCRVCVSTNAGRYLCEYIYYQSLSLREPKVIFVHVPDLDIYSSTKTAEGLFEILKHLIECEMKQECNEV